MMKPIFNSGKFNQWVSYRGDNYLIWVAGLNSEKNILNILKIIDKVSYINLTLCKRIIKNFGNHFGIIIQTVDWTFAAVDYSRGYPIFWKLSNGHLSLSSQANLFRNKVVNRKQLISFRMSGYTTNDNTLWKGIKNLKPGSYLFYKNNNTFHCKEYFSFLPVNKKKYTYRNYIHKLSNQINNLIKKIIRDAKGRPVIIPLSAGLDSRLIASGLRHFNYNNVKCFSYGLKNNFEAVASKKIAKKLGYEWAFVEINLIKAKKFYNSKKCKKFLKDSADGCATSTVQSLYAINELIIRKFIVKGDIVVNGNSGDFISGGHIPKTIPRIIENKKKRSEFFNKTISLHFEKHYSLWDQLKTDDNKKIIKKELENQLGTKKLKEKVPYYGLIECLEYENRQTKYVVNSQRIYDFYKLNWLLPLWNKSYIKFWEQIPLEYKLDQRLYKDTLLKLNYGGVWTDKYNIKSYVSPKWMFFVRLFFKAFFLFIGKNKWRTFEKRFLNYWSENICAFSVINFYKFSKNKNIARNYISYYTLIAEKMNLGYNWQDK